MNANGYVVPTVIEKRGNREYAYDIFSRLLKDRVIFIGGPISDGVANAVCAQLLFLNNQSVKKPINIYLNSPGGVVTGGLAILDTMRYVEAPIHTFCIGQCASMGAVLLAAGDHRYALAHSRVMIHQPWGGAEGTASDIEIQAKEIQRLKKILNGILAEATGKEIEAIEVATDRDNFFSADEALEFGLLDEVVLSTKSVKKSEPDEDPDEEESEESDDPDED